MSITDNIVNDLNGKEDKSKNIKNELFLNNLLDYVINNGIFSFNMYLKKNMRLLPNDFNDVYNWHNAMEVDEENTNEKNNIISNISLGVAGHKYTTNSNREEMNFFVVEEERFLTIYKNKEGKFGKEKILKDLDDKNAILLVFEILKVLSVKHKKIFIFNFLKEHILSQDNCENLLVAKTEFKYGGNMLGFNKNLPIIYNYNSNNLIDYSYEDLFKDLFKENKEELIFKILFKNLNDITNKYFNLESNITEFYEFADNLLSEKNKERILELTIKKLIKNKNKSMFLEKVTNGYFRNELRKELYTEKKLNINDKYIGKTKEKELISFNLNVKEVLSDLGLDYHKNELKLNNILYNLMGELKKVNGIMFVEVGLVNRSEEKSGKDIEVNVLFENSKIHIKEIQLQCVIFNKINEAYNNYFWSDDLSAKSCKIYEKMDWNTEIKRVDYELLNKELNSDIDIKNKNVKAKI